MNIKLLLLGTSKSQIIHKNGQESTYVTFSITINYTDKH